MALISINKRYVHHKPSFTLDKVGGMHKRKKKLQVHIDMVGEV